MTVNNKWIELVTEKNYFEICKIKTEHMIMIMIRKKGVLVFPKWKFLPLNTQIKIQNHNLSCELKTLIFGMFAGGCVAFRLKYQ